MSDADVLSQLGAAVAEVRESSGLSQEEVAERIEQEGRRRQRTRQVRSGTDVDAIERGRKDPNFLTLVDIARAVDRPLLDVFEAFGRIRGADG